jgi:hypothetical protein
VKTVTKTRLKLNAEVMGINFRDDDDDDDNNNNNNNNNNITVIPSKVQAKKIKN